MYRFTLFAAKDHFLGWHDSPKAPYEWMTYEEVNFGLLYRCLNVTDKESIEVCKTHMHKSELLYICLYCNLGE